MVETSSKSLNSSQLSELEKFSARVNKFGVNFAVCSIDGKVVLLREADKFKSSARQLIEAGFGILGRKDEKHSADNSEQTVHRFGENNQILAVVLKSSPGEPAFAALIDTGDAPADENADLSKNSVQADRDYLSEILSLLAENFGMAAKAEEEIEMISSELSQTYEELVLLHKLSTNMRVTEPDSNFLQMACDNLTDIVSVEGIAILQEKSIEEEKRLVLVAGSGLIDIDDHMAAILHERLEEEILSGKEALLDSEVDSPFRYDWPDNVKNIIALPLCGKDKIGTGLSAEEQTGTYIMGMMIAINRIDRPDFDSTDVKLFNSVANGCAVFIENGKLFADLKELFIGSLKALTSSIDAKDPYTRGHSERVAFISRWIAERLVEQGLLNKEQIHEIYLAGLLHDVGKVGIDETILSKEGKLTKREFDIIKKHSSIGAGILSEIRQMSDIVPGVLSHHERIDGKGYPNGLTGDRIPVMGKILGLADSFDAMTSKRTYRDSMTLPEALAEIERELGKQFDRQIGRIFLNSDVQSLWDIMQDGFATGYGTGSLSEYDTMAVGSLIK